MEGYTLPSAMLRAAPARAPRISVTRSGAAPRRRPAGIAPPALLRPPVGVPQVARRARCAATRPSAPEGKPPAEAGGKVEEEAEDDSPAAQRGKGLDADAEVRKDPARRPSGGPGRSTNPLLRALSSAAAAAMALLNRIATNRRLMAVIMSVTFIGALALSAFMGHSRRVASAAQAPKEVLYSEYLGMLQDKSIAHAAYDESGNKVFFTLRPAGGAADRSKAAASTSQDAAAAFNPDTVSRREQYDFYTRPIQNPAVVSQLATAGVMFGTIHSTWSNAVTKVLVTMLMLWVPMMPLLFMMRRMMDRNSGGRKRRGKPGLDRTPPITFADVAGVDTAKLELLEVVACLRDSKRYARLNAKMPSGVLLSGPPGTGKTLLAKAVAGEAGVPFFAASASEFVEMFVGRGAARVRDLFAEARKRAPCVVFIDELDAVGMKRGFGNNEERDQTLNQLLTELDGFEGREGVLLLAATNRPESLDPALLRPGRLSRKVVVPVPDEAGRQAILGIHLRNVPFDKNEDVAVAIAKTARISAGFSGAELANVVNEAAMLAARRNAEAVTLRELIEGVSRTRYGVDGRQLQQGSLGAKVQDWLLDIAAPPSQPKQPPSGAGQQLTG
mmetsp:Transcript_32713/g.83586  ORF Transcript_32713/g.83586 Transcript_32713/m.83586 type:complete len:614 (+) Transcript_32713:291-2132(+)